MMNKRGKEMNTNLVEERTNGQESRRTGWIKESVIGCCE